MWSHPRSASATAICQLRRMRPCDGATTLDRQRAITDAMDRFRRNVGEPATRTVVFANFVLVWIVKHGNRAPWVVGSARAVAPFACSPCGSLIAAACVRSRSASCSTASLPWCASATCRARRGSCSARCVGGAVRRSSARDGDDDDRCRRGTRRDCLCCRSPASSPIRTVERAGEVMRAVARARIVAARATTVGCFTRAACYVFA